MNRPVPPRTFRGVKTNEADFPAGITSSLFDSLISQFVSHLRTLGLNVPQDLNNKLDLEIRISKDVISMPFGVRSINEILQKIKNKWNVSDERMNEISRRLKTGDYTVPGIADTIFSSMDHAPAQDWDDLVEEVADIIGDGGNVADIESSFGSLVAGEYVHSEGARSYIILYDTVIKKDVSTAKTLKQAYSEVYIHELFHAYHHLCSEEAPSKEFARRCDYTASVVKESLAAFFEADFCRNHSIPTDIERDWANNSPAVYPYAGAKYLESGSPGFLADVFNRSLTDFDAALRLLLTNDLDEFYRIKNSVTKQYIRVTRHVPVPATTGTAPAPVAPTPVAPYPTGIQPPIVASANGIWTVVFPDEYLLNAFEYYLRHNSKNTKKVLSDGTVKSYKDSVRLIAAFSGISIWELHNDPDRYARRYPGYNKDRQSAVNRFKDFFNEVFRV